jgi:creatinine amidohydrolase/Fe(II)-dependent formamide hydrolase-like protein
MKGHGGQSKKEEACCGEKAAEVGAIKVGKGWQ